MWCGFAFVLFTFEDRPNVTVIPYVFGLLRSALQRAGGQRNEDFSFYPDELELRTEIMNCWE